MLKLEKFTVRYGKVQAVRNVDIHVMPGESVAILGSNGAGKSSLLRGISGLASAQSECLTLFGRDLSVLQPHSRVAAGLVHVPEGRHVFGPMTVRENLEMGAYLFYADRASRERALAEMLDRFPGLSAKSQQLAGMLSGGEQQMLALARGLMSRPRVLMLDEPSLGLAPVAVDGFYRSLHEQKKAQPDLIIVLVEQSVAVALEEATRVYVLRSGSVAHTGDSGDLADPMELQKFYLGS